MKSLSRTFALGLSIPVVLGVCALLYHLALVRLKIDFGQAGTVLLVMASVSLVTTTVSLFLLWRERGGFLVTLLFGLNIIWLALMGLFGILILLLHSGTIDFHPA